MKTLRVVALVACLALPACYDFDFPLDPKPQVAVDARLLGTWRCLGVEADIDEPPFVVRMERKTDRSMQWTTTSQSPDDKESADYEVYASTLKGGDFLNARDLKADGSGKWSFLRYTLLLADILRIQLVDDEPFEKMKGNAVALRREVEQRKGDPKIYKDFCVCVRIKPTPSPSPKP